MLRTAILLLFVLFQCSVLHVRSASGDPWEECGSAKGEKAIDACSQVIETRQRQGNAIRDDGLADAYAWRGLALLNLGRHQQAIEDLSRAINLNPESHLAYHNRGLAYIQLKQYDQAMADLEMALGARPDSIESSQAYEHAAREKSEAEIVKTVQTRPFEELVRNFAKQVKLFPDASEWTDPQREVAQAVLWAMPAVADTGNDEQISLKSRATTLLVGSGFIPNPPAEIVALIKSFNVIAGSDLPLYAKELAVAAMDEQVRHLVAQYRALEANATPDWKAYDRSVELLEVNETALGNLESIATYQKDLIRLSFQGFDNNVLKYPLDKAVVELVDAVARQQELYGFIEPLLQDADRRGKNSIPIRLQKRDSPDRAVIIHVAGPGPSSKWMKEFRGAAQTFSDALDGALRVSETQHAAFKKDLASLMSKIPNLEKKTEALIKRSQAIEAAFVKAVTQGQFAQTDALSQKIAKVGDEAAVMRTLIQATLKNIVDANQRVTGGGRPEYYRKTIQAVASQATVLLAVSEAAKGYREVTAAINQIGQANSGRLTFKQLVAAARSHAKDAQDSGDALGAVRFGEVIRVTKGKPVAVGVRGPGSQDYTPGHAYVEDRMASPELAEWIRKRRAKLEQAARQKQESVRKPGASFPSRTYRPRRAADGALSGNFFFGGLRPGVTGSGTGSGGKARARCELRRGRLHCRMVPVRGNKSAEKTSDGESQEDGNRPPFEMIMIDDESYRNQIHGVGWPKIEKTSGVDSYIAGNDVIRYDTNYSWAQNPPAEQAFVYTTNNGWVPLAEMLNKAGSWFFEAWALNGGAFAPNLTRQSSTTSGGRPAIRAPAKLRQPWKPPSGWRSAAKGVDNYISSDAKNIGGVELGRAKELKVDKKVASVDINEKTGDITFIDSKGKRFKLSKPIPPQILLSLLHLRERCEDIFNLSFSLEDRSDERDLKWQKFHRVKKKLKSRLDRFAQGLEDGEKFGTMLMPEVPSKYYPVYIGCDYGDTIIGKIALEADFDLKSGWGGSNYKSGHKINGSQRYWDAVLKHFTAGSGGYHRLWLHLNSAKLELAGDQMHLSVKVGIKIKAIKYIDNQNTVDVGDASLPIRNLVNIMQEEYDLLAEEIPSWKLLREVYRGMAALQIMERLGIGYRPKLSLAAIKKFTPLEKISVPSRVHFSKSGEDDRSIYYRHHNELGGVHYGLRNRFNQEQTAENNYASKLREMELGFGIDTPVTELHKAFRRWDLDSARDLATSGLLEAPKSWRLQTLKANASLARFFKLTRPVGDFDPYSVSEFLSHRIVDYINVKKNIDEADLKNIVGSFVKKYNNIANNSKSFVAIHNLNVMNDLFADFLETYDGDGLYVCNRTGSGIDVSIIYLDTERNWIAEGWKTAGSDACLELYSRLLESRYFYVSVRYSGSRSPWTGHKKLQSTPACVRKGNFKRNYTPNETCKTTDLERASFVEIDTGDRFGAKVSFGKRTMRVY